MKTKNKEIIEKVLKIADKNASSGDYFYVEDMIDAIQKALSLKDAEFKEFIRRLKEVLKTYEENAGLKGMYVEHLIMEIDKLAGEELKYAL